MGNKIINKVLNYVIVIMFIVILVIFVINIFKPLMYNMNTKIIESKFEQSPFVNSALDKYIYAIRREKKENIQKIIPIVKRKNQKVYNQYAKYLDENFEFINIISINSIGNNILLVKYAINDSDKNAVIIKVYENTDYFKVYYDEKLESIK